MPRSRRFASPLSTAILTVRRSMRRSRRRRANEGRTSSRGSGTDCTASTSERISSHQRRRTHPA